MIMMLSVITICLVIALAQAQIDRTYVAVVEYQPITNSTNTTDINTGIYVSIVSSIKQQNPNVGLVVFPESTLPPTSRENSIEIFKRGDIPHLLESYPQFVQNISKAASDFNTFIVVNTLEKEKCLPKETEDNCKNFGYKFYNSNLVFDKNGSVIGSYRKYNLFGEFDKDRPTSPDSVIFDLKPNVRFGLFTCFDVLFKNPAQKMTSEAQTSFLMPTMWFSELPFLTAMQAQQMWAQAHNARLFSAGAHNHLVGSGGTGIHAGRQGLVQGGYDVFPGTNYKTYIYSFANGVPPDMDLAPTTSDDIDTLSKAVDDVYLITDLSLPQAYVVPLNLKMNNTNIIFSSDNNVTFSCQLDYRISVDESVFNNNSYVYFLAAYAGQRSFSGVYYGGVSYCGIISCLNQNKSSCGKRFPKYEDVAWATNFEYVSISVSLEKSENITQYPNSLLSSLLPLNPSTTNWTTGEFVGSNGGTYMRGQHTLVQPQNRLLTFAVFGRDFSSDYDPKRDVRQEGRGGSVKSASISMVFAVILLLLLAVL